MRLIDALTHGTSGASAMPDLRGLLRLIGFIFVREILKQLYDNCQYCFGVRLIKVTRSTHDMAVVDACQSFDAIIAYRFNGFHTITSKELYHNILPSTRLKEMGR